MKFISMFCQKTTIKTTAQVQNIFYQAMKKSTKRTSYTCHFDFNFQLI